MRNKDFRLVERLMYDKNNPFMNHLEDNKPKGLVKSDVDVEEYPEEMKVKYENVMPSGWL